MLSATFGHSARHRLLRFHPSFRRRCLSSAPAEDLTLLEEVLVQVLSNKPRDKGLNQSLVQARFRAAHGRLFDFKSLNYTSLSNAIASIESITSEFDPTSSDYILFLKDKDARDTDNHHASYSTRLVQDVEDLEDLKSTYPFDCSYDNIKEMDWQDRAVVIDCKLTKVGGLSLVQVGTNEEIYVLDSLELGDTKVCNFLRDLLADKEVLKMFSNLHRDAAILHNIDSSLEFNSVLDIQLVAEAATGSFEVSHDAMKEFLGQTAAREPPKKGSALSRWLQGEDIFAKRPLEKQVMDFSTADVSMLLTGKTKIFAHGGGDPSESMLEASAQRMAHIFSSRGGGRRRMLLDVHANMRMTSAELFHSSSSSSSTTATRQALERTPVQVKSGTKELLKVLPPRMADVLLSLGHSKLNHLNELSLDLGQRPVAWFGRTRHILDECEPVNEADLKCIEDQVGAFGTDNRAALEGSLHRISAIRNRNKKLIGLTLRNGRHISGSVYALSDLLAQRDKSILFLGEPGSGKTTLIREVARILAEDDTTNVIIVDTSNEIAGDGNIKDENIGHARRMMVTTKSMQKQVMLECVQNHTPQVMVIDEIGRYEEVSAARTCKFRGVRLIASAHGGDLRSLVKNPDLQGLVGGVQSVQVGDDEARHRLQSGKSDTFRKTVAERAGPPIFDVVIELGGAETGQDEAKQQMNSDLVVVPNSGLAVDAILNQATYRVERRAVDEPTGHVMFRYQKR